MSGATSSACSTMMASRRVVLRGPDPMRGRPNHQSADHVRRAGHGGPLRDALHAAWLAEMRWFSGQPQHVSRLVFGDRNYLWPRDGSTTFNLPDLRGEFIRGWSSDRPLVDVGRVFGSAQISTQVLVDDDANEVVGSIDWTNNNLAALGYEPPSVNSIHLHYAKSIGGAVHSASFARSIRPRNLALLACIKY